MQDSSTVSARFGTWPARVFLCFWYNQWVFYIILRYFMSFHVFSASPCWFGNSTHLFWYLSDRITFMCASMGLYSLTFGYFSTTAESWSAESRSAWLCLIVALGREAKSWKPPKIVKEKQRLWEARLGQQTLQATLAARWIQEDAARKRTVLSNWFHRPLVQSLHIDKRQRKSSRWQTCCKVVYVVLKERENKASRVYAFAMCDCMCIAAWSAWFWTRNVVLQLPVVPRQAVAEVSKTEHL